MGGRKVGAWHGCGGAVAKRNAIAGARWTRCFGGEEANVGNWLELIWQSA